MTILYVEANLYGQWENNIINKVFPVAQTFKRLFTGQINIQRVLFSNVKYTSVIFMFSG